MSLNNIIKRYYEILYHKNNENNKNNKNNENIVKNN